MKKKLNKKNTKLKNKEKPKLIEIKLDKLNNLVFFGTCHCSGGGPNVRKWLF